jgi:uncharacterized protein (DUF427 family)
MSTRLRDVLMQRLDELRHEPIDKRIRATLGDETVVDSTRALLVWEPRRIVPTYAVPVEDIAAEIGEAEPDGDPGAPPAGVPAMGAPILAGRRVYDPSIPFSIHTAEGQALQVRARGSGRSADAFRPRDPSLADFVVLDFDAFDAWYEEDERNYAHPRDPFHRIDIVRSSRRVRVEVDGETLAESERPRLLFEPPLPVRYYLPPEDVRTDLLRPSDTRTFCAYKGEASYWTAKGEDDIAWSYPRPLREAAEVVDHLAFFNERATVIVDGVVLERPVTPWSR